MKYLAKPIAGQSILSWVFQVALIVLAWKVADHTLANNLTTITIAAVLLIAIYLSINLDRKMRRREEKKQ
ncbi:MAG: hypothetical protein ABF679_03905 [Lentilactobacillus diolivorans]|jgi:hypothetical protein|uniref:Uncharacterized protein n=2 Tax=Lentilactobacillus diolivorans TaxID=179838 RepID=A0A0R1SV75_9LACO|nr:hypothetical protein [Lentilactobacillus diolivorans]KRL69211.1 hypothetical protein FC85_GL001569 [Lentilactobacillus diolivorans DSM 14421]MCH4164612.1 hypothetical protein [Lentilactobacillus diolivorans]RRG01068.1 MAG: hypothetical protein DUD34_13475 [Lactobacillus sp.]GEP23941.1 hypothetical protein LDI01_15340 [Lentilactobacillus diolivorans]